MLFGVVFVRKSFVISSEAFTRADHTHWTLDVGRTAGGAYQDVRDVCLFIPEGNLLDNNSALVLYVQAGNSTWEYRGCVSNASPSEVFPLQWPLQPDGSLPPNAQIGVSVEPIADTIGKAQLVLGRAKRERAWGRASGELVCVWFLLVVAFVMMCLRVELLRKLHARECSDENQLSSVNERGEIKRLRAAARIAPGLRAITPPVRVPASVSARR